MTVSSPNLIEIKLDRQRDGKDSFDFVCSRGSNRRSLALSGNMTPQRDCDLRVIMCPRLHHAQAPTVLDHSRTLPRGGGCAAKKMPRLGMGAARASVVDGWL